MRTAFGWQLLFDQLFTWPTDQPRHATSTCGEPVKSDRPLGIELNVGLGVRVLPEANLSLYEEGNAVPSWSRRVARQAPGTLYCSARAGDRQPQIETLRGPGANEFFTMNHAAGVEDASGGLKMSAIRTNE